MLQPLVPVGRGMRSLQWSGSDPPGLTAVAVGNRQRAIVRWLPKQIPALQVRGPAEKPMYARVTTFKVDPARIAELPAKVAEMGPRAKLLPGIVDVYAAWRSDGQGVVVALYESKEAADRAVARIQALWGNLAGLIAGAPRTDAYETAERLTA